MHILNLIFPVLSPQSNNNKTSKQRNPRVRPSLLSLRNSQSYRNTADAPIYITKGMSNSSSTEMQEPAVCDHSPDSRANAAGS